MTIEELRSNFKVYFEEYLGVYYDALIVDSILDDLQEELEAKDKAIKEAISHLDEIGRVAYARDRVHLTKAQHILKEAL